MSPATATNSPLSIVLQVGSDFRFCQILSDFKMKVRVAIFGILWLTVLSSSVAFADTTEDGDKPHPSLITIKQGKIQGLTLESRKGRKYFGYLGIPYGNVPLRFEPPKPADSWTGVKQATKRAPHCFQYCLVEERLRGVENCLTLNVYSPNLKGNLPVMILFHGGGFQLGSGNFHDAKYFMDEDVILVTTQFRVGALGFLNTEDEVVSGNMGLKDQSLALKWVSENIDKFGGNREKVTIFGFSAGGASVHYHVLSPMSKGLFSGAIAQSGSALNPWAFQSKPKELATRLAEKIKCPLGSSKEIVDCLRSKTPSEIVNAQLSFSKFDHVFDLISMLFCPSVEKGNVQEKFLDDTPYKLMTTGRIANKVPLVIGLTAEEGAFYTAAILEDDRAMEKMNSDWHKMAPNIFYFEDSTSPSKYNKISTKTYDYYFGKDKITRDNYLALGAVFGDRFFNAAVRRTILEHAKTTDFPVYPYIFNYEGSQSIVQGILHAKRSYGVAHCEDLHYLFNQTFGMEEYGLESEDGKFSEKLVKLYVSFAKDGKPTSTWGAEKVWQPFQMSGEEASANIPYYVIDKETKVLKEDPFKAGMEFWESLPLKEHVNEDTEFPEDKDEL